jgi:hypothetical protein
VDEPSRVSVAAPVRDAGGSAAVELRHLVAELVDEAAAASAGARVEVDARLEPDGALWVDVVVAGRGWTDALVPSRGTGAASRIASGSPGARRADPAGAAADRPRGGCRRHRGVPGRADHRARRRRPLVPGVATPTHLHDPRPARIGALRPTRPRNGGDELFGPLPDVGGRRRHADLRSRRVGWFRDDERGPATDDWDSAGDREWREASARATRVRTCPQTTASGLPRRSPGDRLVPPPRASRPSAPPDERVPERVRDRLATYQRGLQQGRHRAADAAPTPTRRRRGPPTAGSRPADRSAGPSAAPARHIQGRYAVRPAPGGLQGARPARPGEPAAHQRPRRRAVDLIHGQLRLAREQEHQQPRAQ